MKIAVLSRNPRSYTAKRLRDAAKARGHQLTVLDTLQCAISLEEGRPELYYRGKPVPMPDAVIPRIGASVTYFGTAVVRQFEQMGVFCLNTAMSITVSRDKLRSLQVLSKYDVGLPPTEFVRSKSDVLPAIERVGGVPVIIKLLEGTQGIGVILAESIKTAEAIIETLQSTKQNVLIQRFVAESKGSDVRAFVVGDKVVAVMKRSAKPGEFRSNVHRGGSTKVVDLTPAEQDLAVRAAQIMGLRCAGVDMLESSDGLVITEVNSSPGLEGIEGATKHDIAGEIIDYIEQRVVMPEIDLRQRLTVCKGYGVSEFHVPKGSALHGKTLSDTALSSHGIHVLTIDKNSSIVPNPHGDTTIEVGDKMVCYGPLDVMREQLPTRPKPKRKPKRKPTAKKTATKKPAKKTAKRKAPKKQAKRKPADAVRRG